MELPAASDPVWEKLINDTIQVQLSYLGTKILLGNLKINTANKSMEDMTKELHGMFKKNLSHPKVLADLKQVIG